MKGNSLGPGIERESSIAVLTAVEEKGNGIYGVRISPRMPSCNICSARKALTRSVQMQK